MIKPNMDEVGILIGKPLENQEECIPILMDLKELGIFMSVLSLGKNGCIAHLEEEIFRFFTPELPVVNTVGSGDSFVAGCAVALSRGWESIDVIRLGMACGMANTQFFKTGMISLELVEKFLTVITVERI